MDSGRKLKNRYSFLSFLSRLRKGRDCCFRNLVIGKVNAVQMEITGQNQSK